MGIAPTVGGRAGDNRYDLKLQARGLISESFQTEAGATNAALTGGTLYAQLVGLRGGDKITNLDYIVITPGASLTHGILGLYDKTGKLLGQSADTPAAFQAAGLVELALAVPVAIPQDDGYYIAILTAGTTPPAIYSRGTTGFAAYTQGFGAGAALSVTGGTGLSALPAQATFAAENSHHLWAACR